MRETRQIDPGQEEAARSAQVKPTRHKVTPAHTPTGGGARIQKARLALQAGTSGAPHAKSLQQPRMRIDVWRPPRSSHLPMSVVTSLSGAYNMYLPCGYL